MQSQIAVSKRLSLGARRLGPAVGVGKVVSDERATPAKETFLAMFARNERAVAIFSTAIGPMAMVLVGATIVASIETVWGGTIAPAKNREIQYWDYSDQDITLEKGAEMGRFKLGSTIVALFPKDTVNFAEALQAGSVTRLGELFATSTATK